MQLCAFLCIDLFSSRDASHELPCGHAIHWHCFRELASHDSRCPCCKKTAETHERLVIFNLCIDCIDSNAHV